MSAIGSYVRIRPTDLDRCLVLAERATPERPFRWPWQPKVESTLETFTREWAAATLDEAVFDYSGYALGSYFLAQGELNKIEDPFDAPESQCFSKVFTAAFCARTPRSFPPMDQAALERFCRSEWPDDAPGMVDAIKGAHDFFRAGMSRVTGSEVVVFIIS